MTKHALVTGGNRGIGRAIAQGLLEKGLSVTIGCRKPEEAQKAANALPCDYVELDVSNKESIKSIGDQIAPVDVLVNNAGVLFNRPCLTHPEDFEACMAVMVHGPFELIGLLSPSMIQKGYGRIVNLSSDWGSFAHNLEGPGAYGIAKASLNALTLALSRELPDTVKINSMCPGWVRTQMGGESAIRTPEEGADTALWLATLHEGGPTGGFFRDRKPFPW
ncbi:SDR family NAD(P)-dependent oxidoreductase [Flexibacterium corallicola]|uniref:SDR family NAD(P)-dependent oxidoreductase n=1 Tax=Flexibacterium corallicola TaxID=3037259 RepID=UPI00286EEC27|nr:SDR family NAD(P)-dependent oxidoreductase [Pseudovibrio sp. M1P-2-3]